MNISQAEYFIHTQSLFMTRTGVHSGLEKHRFHQAEEQRSPDLRKSDQIFVFVRVSIKERSWLKFIKRARSKRYTFPCNQVIPGNLQKYVSTCHSLFQCKTLPAHFSNNMMVCCLLNVI